MLVRREEVEAQKRYYYPLLRKSIFIHPTDLMYSIGCDARNNPLVMRLRVLKHWQTHPFNIIAPSKEWIREHTDLPEEALNQLPGPITLVGHLTNPDALAQEVHLGTNVIGVRIPDHWIAQVVNKLGFPIISTCANKRSHELMTSIDDAHPELVRTAKLVLHEGVKSGKQPLFIDYTEKEQQIITE